MDHVSVDPSEEKIKLSSITQYTSTWKIKKNTIADAGKSGQWVKKN